METRNFTERFNFLVGDNRMEFSKKTGLPYTTVTNIQKGTEPGIKVVMKILKSLPDLSAEWLLRGTEPVLIDLTKEDSEEVARMKAGLSSLCMKYEMLERMYVEKCIELQTLKNGINEQKTKTD